MSTRRRVLVRAGVVAVALCLTASTDGRVGERWNGLLDMLVILDRSGSMSGSNWNGSLAGLTDFFFHPTSAETSVGLNFFPVEGAGNQCDPSLYDPPQVPLGELPGEASALVAALNGQAPTGATTPTHPALDGSLLFAVAHQGAHPGRVVIVVLVTDGMPSECETSIPSIAALASNAHNSSGVRTYVVGLPGAVPPALDMIAGSGGTGAAHILADASLLGETLSQIRVDALGPAIFDDGFESGDASEWSSVIP